MSARATVASEISDALLEEAADWLVRLHAGEDSPALRRELERWRGQSPAHAAAWQQAEIVLGSFRQVPGQIGRRTLDGLPRHGRRGALRGLGLLALAAPAGWLLWRHQPWSAWQADLRTATGEQRSLQLADGTLLTLASASAVDIRYTEHERQLRLIEGEVMITTAPDKQPRPRPFVVLTAQGRLLPLGTRFSVRQFDGATELAVYEGAVRIHTRAGAERTVPAGERARFDGGAIAASRPAAAGDALWADGMLVARDMRLADWVAEIGRYRPGVLRCDPAVAELRVSGAFPLQDTEASLDLLLKTRPLAARRITRYWISLEAPPEGV
ncbi:FecR domain-containing protein [Azoarcus indigens]|uniref:FecR family protein n=1 Tax=Azoarcus indigens TaxID=29545 RepID=A0A4R6DJM9_9RHOO|nr:FecR family protein [Azoarcus indigens]TDN44981.1 FecR family protein [Azoarcus indigens]